MTIGAAMAIIQAIIAAYPAVKGAIESIASDVAKVHGLDPIALIKSITEPGIVEVDESIDAELNARING